jgi:hypothetical protein
MAPLHEKNTGFPEELTSGIGETDPKPTVEKVVHDASNGI